MESARLEKLLPARYAASHEKNLHLIAVRCDTSAFQHVHPVIDDSGTWSVELNLTSGNWKLFADIQPADGTAMTLGIDVTVIGHYESLTLPAATGT